MPLDDVGRRYADKLFLNRHEEIVTNRDRELRTIRADDAKRGTLKSGAGIRDHARVFLESIQQMGEAKSESLLKAYEKSGLPFDDAALQEVTTEVNRFCHGQQHRALDDLVKTIRQFATATEPGKLLDEITQQVINGVDAVMTRLTRNLSIKRDEVILDELRVRKAYAAGLGKEWDVFICHASEDKESFVRPLADALIKSGLSVWYDEISLKVGDSLRKAIDDGLANSRYGIVVLSNSFFAKNWPQHELDGLMSKEIAGTKVILPIWHEISLEDVRSNSPILSGLVAAKSDEGIDVVVRKLRDAMGL